MPRVGMTAGLIAQVTSESTLAAHLVELDFASGQVRMTDAFFDLEIDGLTYQAVGGTIAYDRIEEANNLENRGLRLSLSNQTQALIPLVLGAEYQNRQARVFRVYYDRDTGSIVGSKIELFRGLMNGGIDIEDIVPPESTQDKTSTIHMTLQDLLMELESIGGIQANPDSHQAFYPGDKGLQFMFKLADRQITWGRERVPQR